MGQKRTKLLNKTHKQRMLYLSFGEMGHHAPAGRKHLSISLSNGGGSMAQWGNVSGREGDVGGLRGKEVSSNPWVA